MDAEKLILQACQNGNLNDIRRAISIDRNCVNTARNCSGTVPLITAMAAYPGLLRASRLVSGRCLTYRDWDTLVELPQELLAELEAGDRWLGDASPRRVRRPARQVHVWTDASDQGGGVVVLDPTRRTVLAR
ncbi:hypothetical protein DIPPA_03717 [Diplonema papillatum]|nr:hypothetical protein DIPPA_03717 [Diplonema papillatum]